jgi:hypothetical protein
VQQEQKEGRDEEGHACHDEACPIVTHLVYKESWVNERWDTIITMSVHVLSSSVIMGYKECVPLTKDCFLLPHTKLFKNTTGQRVYLASNPSFMFDSAYTVHVPGQFDPYSKYIKLINV